VRKPRKFLSKAEKKGEGTPAYLQDQVNWSYHSGIQGTGLENAKRNLEYRIGLQKRREGTSFTHLSPENIAKRNGRSPIVAKGKVIFTTEKSARGRGLD